MYDPGSAPVVGPIYGAQQQHATIVIGGVRHHHRHHQHVVTYTSDINDNNNNHHSPKLLMAEGLESQALLGLESRKKAEIGGLDRLEIVDLSGLFLDTLPRPSLNLEIICKLDLSNNNLQNIPEPLMARLLNVVIFDVHSNQLRSLPISVGCLSKLRVLNVAGNLLEYIPKTIENCKSLEELNANFNKLCMLPETIGFELTNLKKLSVNSNKLLFLPRSVSNMTALKVLDVRLNCLRCLPEDLENLINLEILNVSQNFQYLESLPYSIGLLVSLVELDVSYNKIKSLPDSMGCMKKLKKLSVEGNPLVSPPIEIMELGLYAVKEYLSEKMSSGQSPSKKKSWIGKLVKYGTFSGSNNLSLGQSEEREGFIMPYYRSIDGLTSPRYSGTFSPRRLFSPRSYFSR